MLKNNCQTFLLELIVTEIEKLKCKNIESYQNGKFPDLATNGAEAAVAREGAAATGDRILALVAACIIKNIPANPQALEMLSQVPTQSPIITKMIHSACNILGGI